MTLSTNTKLDALHDDLTALRGDIAALAAKVDSLVALDGFPIQSEPVVISAMDHVFTLAVNYLYVSGGGTLIYQLVDDTEDRTITVIGGMVIPGRFAKVIKTGTTATGLVGWKIGS